MSRSCAPARRGQRRIGHNSLRSGPVLFYAVVLAVRRDGIPPAGLDGPRTGFWSLWLSRCSELLPDGSDGDPASLLLLERRQAQALTLGQHQRLTRLAARLGLAMAGPGL